LIAGVMMGEMLRRPLLTTRPSTLRTVVVALVAASFLAGCTDSTAPTPTPTLDSPERAASQLADGLAQADLSRVEFASATSADVNTAFQALVAGMGPVHPDVGVASLNAQNTYATATLRYTWTFPGVPTSWVYDTTADLAREGGRWKTRWTPALVQPGLDGGNRLSQHRLYPERGEVLGEDGDVIVTLRPVVRIGLDKSSLSADQLDSSARRLAALVGVDAKAYVAAVKAAGPQAFVEAIVFRATDKRRPANKTVARIKGALAIDGEQMLAPSADFARPVIGTVGEATKEIVDESGGAVVAGDQVGISGLQRRYDAELRGTPGVTVQLVAAKPTASASPSASPTADPSSGSGSSSGGSAATQTLFQVRPVAGRDLKLTMNVGLQKLAEKTLADTKPASALVAIRPSTGAVLAVANGPGTDGQSAATVGQYPPGSTFKVATSLALLRAGEKPDSSLNCPAKIQVDGRQFKNYDDYPSGHLGKIDLRTALAQSCNTAFISQAGKVSDADLAAAAGSLGLGIDYDVGFSSYFGSVPDEGGATSHAAAMIGQGKVQASPLAMAAVVGSVQAGKTVIPHLVDGRAVKSKGQTLTAAEAKQLKSMMRSVVTDGSGRLLSGLDGPRIIAKTGTAEYGNKQPPRTHVWMIAAQGDLAVAVFVADGASGSGTAGPLLKQFLRHAR
jgi:cell division protein FtsI/penicillin-binding protein 2